MLFRCMLDSVLIVDQENDYCFLTEGLDAFRDMVRYHLGILHQNYANFVPMLC